MKENLEMFLLILWLFVWTILLTTLILLMITVPIDYLKCNQRYTDTDFKILWWCMIKYNWEYIPEHLYIKAFEQNVNLK